MTANLSGSWLGTYWQLSRPTAFEMQLLEADGQLFGRIRDLSKLLPEATLSGQHGFGNVSFQKRYIKIFGHVVHYRGAVSADANLIEGEWSFSASMSHGETGTW